MTEYISTVDIALIGVLGSLLTLLAQSIINLFVEKIKYRRSQSALIFKRKLEVSEKAIAWYQSLLDSYHSLNFLLKTYDERCDERIINSIMSALDKVNDLFHKSEKQLNPIYLYYDFSRYEKQGLIEEMNNISYSIILLGKEIHKLPPMEEFKERYDELNKKRVELVHKLADAYQCYIEVITSITKEIRREYRRF